MLASKIERFIKRDLKAVLHNYNSFHSVFDCANSHFSDKSICFYCTLKNKHSHQYHLNNDMLYHFAERVSQAVKNWGKIESFESLISIIRGLIPNTSMLALLTYDCASRISYFKYRTEKIDFRPKEYVYIHAGVYKGAMWLYNNGYITYIPKNNSLIPIDEFRGTNFDGLFDVLKNEAYSNFTKSMLLEAFMCLLLQDDVKLCKKCRVLSE